MVKVPLLLLLVLRWLAGGAAAAHAFTVDPAVRLSFLSVCLPISSCACLCACLDAADIKNYTSFVGARMFMFVFMLRLYLYVCLQPGMTAAQCTLATRLAECGALAKRIASVSDKPPPFGLVPQVCVAFFLLFAHFVRYVCSFTVLLFFLSFLQVLTTYVRAIELLCRDA